MFSSKTCLFTIKDGRAQIQFHKPTLSGTQSRIESNMLDGAFR